MAHAVLSSTYRVIGETRLGEQSATKAYEFRASVSGPERFYIESTYYHYMTGDLEKARQVNELAAQIYPRNSSPRIRLWQLYVEEGQFETALPHIQDAIRLEPWKGVAYENRVSNLMKLNRMQEAEAEVRRTLADHSDASGLRIQLYKLGFLDNDSRAMAQQIEYVRGKQHFEASMLELEAQTAAYFGHLRESRELAQRAEESAFRTHGTEFAASVEVNTALLESLFGQRLEPRTLDMPVADPARGRMAKYVFALTCALSGDSHRAQTLADDLSRRYSDDTLVQFNFLPTIRAQIALNHSDPSKAIEILQSAGPYELSPVWWDFLGPVYVRGEAYLMAHRGAEAAAEFQKVIDHRGLVVNNPTGALAHVQLGRAYAVMGDSSKAKSEYREFLTLWKDADPDIPFLKQARAEYEKL